MRGTRTIVRVVRVIDGDTIKVALEDNREIVVRLLFVDTPEIKHPTKSVEPYGEEASLFTKEKLKINSKIMIEFERNMIDIFNRFLAHVWYKENGKVKLLQEQLLLEGLASLSYTKYHSESIYIDRLVEAEQIAKKLGKNIWS